MNASAIQAEAADSNTQVATIAETIAGRQFAAAGYVFWPLAVWSITKRDNAFELYHAKQSLGVMAMLVLLQVAVMIVATPLAMMGMASLVMLLSLAIFAAAITAIVIGAHAAWWGETRPLPLIGPAVEWLTSGVRKR